MILCKRNQQKEVGKKVFFEVDRDIVERLTHRAKSEIQQTIKVNQDDTTPADSESARGPLVETDLTKRLTRSTLTNQGKAKSTRVETGKAKKCQAEKTESIRLTHPKRLRRKADMSWLRLVSSSQLILKQGRMR